MVLKRIKSSEMELPWECTIRKGINGFVISRIYELDDGLYREIENFFEEGSGIENLCLSKESLNEEDVESKVAMLNALYHIIELFALERNDHRRININIELEENKDD
ncbi:hypothetical protein [Pseudoalteromonas sp.]|uniref:hypothetical protein n=1 Tax=Pseudoalteromonas sp. TaxID=53249 RepID=UPI002602244F|nr:hypothetical protein [Pseudoalteromonas sp.]MCP4585360.1 hypothetical protein [Pseudoalteromonas sp.]